jgi:hypothetical protein
MNACTHIVDSSHAKTRMLVMALLTVCALVSTVSNIRK